MNNQTSDITKGDELAYTINVYVTTDYAKFRKLAGNRPKDASHVRKLTRAMAIYGNFTQDEPVTISPDGEILDGQHREEAAENNKYPVFYMIKDTLNIDTVRRQNTGRRNWNWQDVLGSYAEQGYSHYEALLQIHEDYPSMAFKTLLLYSGQSNLAASDDAGGVSARARFSEGDFKIEDLRFTRKMLKQLQEIVIAAGFKYSFEASHATYKFMRKPSYNHEHMLNQLNKFEGDFDNCYTMVDFYVALEEVYNIKDGTLL